MEMFEAAVRQRILLLAILRLRNFGSPFNKSPFLSRKNKEKLLSPFLSCLFLAQSHFNTPLLQFLPNLNVQNTSVPQPKPKPQRRSYCVF